MRKGSMDHPRDELLDLEWFLDVQDCVGNAVARLLKSGWLNKGTGNLRIITGICEHRCS